MLYCVWDVGPQNVLSVAISPDSRWAAVGLGTGDALDPDTTIYLFDLMTGERVRRFFGHSEGVMDLAFAPDGSFFLSAGYDNLVCLWDMDTGERRHTLRLD